MIYALRVVVTTRLALLAAVVAGTATGTTLAVGVATSVAFALGGLAGAGGTLGLVDAIEADLALLVDLKDADLDLVADVEDILDLVDAALGNARDVEQAVLAGQQLNEGAEGLDADDAAGVLLAHLGNLDDGLDALGGGVARAVRAGDEDGAVLLDVDRGAGVLLDAANDLAAGADDLTDLVGRNLEADDLRRAILGGLAGRGNGVEHGIEDEHAALVRLHKRRAQNLGREAGGLVVHLHGGDALGGARHLEVHVAEEVLETLDVGEDDGLALLLNEAHGNAGDGALQRHAGIHESERGAAGGGHRGRAVGLHDLGDDADRVGEVLLGGNHGEKGALGEVAVADLAALRGAHAAGLTGAERREVVVVDVALAIDGLDGIEALPLVEHAEGADGEHLGLATLEETRAVDAGKVIGLDHERANLVGSTAVDALAGLDDHEAHGVLLESLELDGDGAAPLGLLLLGELGADGILQGLDLADTGELVGVLEGSLHLAVVGENAVVDLGDGLVEDVLAHLDRAVGLLDLCEELILLLAEGGDGLLAEGHGGEHVLLGDLVGAGLEHADEVGGAAELEIKVGVVALLVGRVDDELAGVTVATDAHAGERALEGHAADGQRGAGGHDADGVDRVDLVGDERRCDDLDLVAEAGREGRAQRAVDHARGEGRLLGRASLTLEVTAGDAAHGVHLLDEVDRQREEVVVLALLADDGGEKDRRLAALDEDGAGGLLGQLAGLKGVVLAVEVELMGYFSHSCFPYLRLPLCRRAISRGPSPLCSPGSSRDTRQGAPAGAPVLVSLCDLLNVVADTEALDEVTVVLDVVLLDVAQETTTLTDEHEEAAAGVEVLLVGLHVLGELLDAGGEDGDLDLGGTGVGLGLAVLLDELGLLLLGDHVDPPFLGFAPVWVRRRWDRATKFGVPTNLR